MRQIVALPAVAFLFAFGVFVTPIEANEWTGGGGDNLWTTVENWSQGVVPINAISDPRFGFDDPDGPFYPLTSDTSDDGVAGNNDVKLQTNDTVTLIDDSVHAKAYGVRVGSGGAINTLHVTGGVLDIGGSESGGNPSAWHLQVGWGYPGFNGGPVNSDPLATVLMSGGTVNTNGLLIPEQFVNNDLADPTDSFPLNGELIMTGGTMNARWMNLGQLKGNGRAEISGDAVINLWPNLSTIPTNGGHLIFNRDWFLNGQPVPSTGNVEFDISDNAAVNIFGNVSETAVTPNQSELDRYQSYIDAGFLTANGGTDEPIIELLDCPSDGSLDHFCVAQKMITITAPVPEVVGDFDSNGTFDCGDIDALILAIAAGSSDLSFDVNGDSAVTIADRDAWMVVAGAAQLPSMNAYLLGDLDLNGSVNSMDLGVLLNNFAANIGIAYCGGEIDADSQVNSADLGLLLNNFGSSAAGVVAVPEPGMTYLAVFAFGILGWLRARSPGASHQLKRV